MEMAQQELPDLILIDIQKVKSNGSEVCKHLKSTDITSHIPVIRFISTQSHNHRRASNPNHGADAYLSHPVNNSELIPLVKTMLRLKKAEDTLQREREQKLQESELVFSQMFEQSSPSTFLYNPDGYSVSINPEFYKMFGVDKKEITDGRYHLYRDQVASDARLIPILREIFDSKKASGALYESNERYTALFNRLQDAVYINDLEGNFIDANIAAQNLLGYTKDEIQTMNFASLLDEKQVIHAHDILQEIIETGTQNEPAQYRLKRKNGEFVWVELTSVLHYKDGEPVGIQGIARDISKRKDAEKQLKLAKEQAEAASLSKTQFLTNMSHELRTPMQGILGFASLGIQRLGNLSKEKVLDYFQEIHSSGHRLMSLLNALLDLSKLESGKTEYKFSREKISQIVITIINELKAIVLEKQITIVFKDPEFDDHLIVDKEKIFQVIRNLLSNAVKFSNPKTKIRIDVVKNNEYLTISIIDNGVGIPAAELESVFDKFTQSSNTRTGAGGTGLGLAICQEIIKAHAGRIWAENNPQGGAIIRFNLPFHQKTN